MKEIDKFINDQLSQWPAACGNFRALRKVKTRRIVTGGLEVVLQHNPARIVSSAANTDPDAIRHRKCFLCRASRPKEQFSLDFEGRKGRKYDILLNPYPIFRNHLVIALAEHSPQSIWRRYVDMLDLASKFRDYIVFYNGPQCGASAPDHHHFQAASRGQMPLEVDVDSLLDNRGNSGGDGLRYLSSVLDAELFLYGKYLPGIFVIRGTTSKSVAKQFYRLLDCALWNRESQPEPLCNVFAWYSSGEYRSIVVFRSSHRSSHYFSDGPDHLTMSPGCADMAGLLVVPVEQEFAGLDRPLLESMLSEVSIGRKGEALMVERLTRGQRKVEVGIMSGKMLRFEILTDGAGPRTALYRDGKIEYDGYLYDELFFEERTLSTMFAEPSFVLYDVTIGAGFHWERKEVQKFAGALKIMIDGDRLTAVNIVGIEDYLVSVISSEMKSTAPLEFLKAHAVISRSWLLKQMQGRGPRRAVAEKVPGNAGEDCFVRWYDRTDHDLFDVCADDHCQRYQGLTRALCDGARVAVDTTWGQVLAYGGEICDARFSKCCGGVTERFSTCWDDHDPDYLQGLNDSFPEKPLPFSGEASFRDWLLGGDSDAFCARATPGFLADVLNSYDLETTDFFRWQTVCTRAGLSSVIMEKSGVDIGEIQALVPLERGTSGRISLLRAVGSRRSVVFGKELEIRRVLSVSHLKSSAFVVDYLDRDGNVLPEQEVRAAALAGKHTEFEKILLRGAGWGHGVGLCQVGAAVMAREGHDYKEILEHYYPGATASTAE